MHFLKKYKILNMNNKRLLSNLTLMFKIKIMNHIFIYAKVLEHLLKFMIISSEMDLVLISSNFLLTSY